MSSSAPPACGLRYRVNARLDDTTRSQLSALEARLQLSTTEVIRESIRRMYGDIEASRSDGEAMLDALVGKFEGPADLSEDVKASLTASLSAKHELRRKRR